MLGTPRGPVRTLLSTPLLTLLTGLYATALGGAMVDQMVRIYDPTFATFGAQATSVSVLVIVRGLATMVVGAGWKTVKDRLGRKGALLAALGLPVRVGELSESRVVLALSTLGLALLLPAGWLLVAPGFLPFAVLFTLAAVLTAWARMPMNRWAEGSRGASLNNTAKAGSIAVGAAVSAPVLGGFSTRIGALVHAGRNPAVTIASATHALVLLMLPIVVLPIVVAFLFGKLRIGPIDDLRLALARVGAADDQVKAIAAKLTSRGLNDVGSVRALFARPGWRPLLVPERRLRLAQRRRDSVALTEEEHALVQAALAHIAARPAAPADPPDPPAAPVRTRSRAAVVSAWMRDTGPPLTPRLPAYLLAPLWEHATVELMAGDPDGPALRRLGLAPGGPRPIAITPERVAGLDRAAALTFLVEEVFAPAAEVPATRLPEVVAPWLGEVPVEVAAGLAEQVRRGGVVEQVGPLRVMRGEASVAGAVEEWELAFVLGRAGERVVLDLRPRDRGSETDAALPRRGGALRWLRAAVGTASALVHALRSAAGRGPDRAVGKSVWTPVPPRRAAVPVPLPSGCEDGRGRCAGARSRAVVRSPRRVAALPVPAVASASARIAAG